MKNRSWQALAALLLLFLAGASPARAEWRRAESPNFVVYSTLPESRLRERVLLLEDFDRLLRVITSISTPPSPAKLHVYLLESVADVGTVRAVPDGIQGFYIATPHGIAAVLDGRAEGGNELLFHEYAHHFMWQYSPGVYPAWYVEGFAEYFMTVRFTPRHIDIGNFSQGRVYSIDQGRWLPTDRILAGPITGLNSEALMQFYAQAWLTVHYFYSNPQRQEALRRYLVAARGGDYRAALQSATGMTVEAFAEELRRYIAPRRITYRRMDRSSATAPPPVAITTLPRGADDLILYDAALRIGIEEERQQPYLERIRAAAARHPGDRFAGRVLAHAELLHGDLAAADRQLDPLFAAEPGNAEYMYLKGMRHLTAAERVDAPEAELRGARDWFTRAHRADPNHFQTLYRYAQSLRGERAFGSQNTANVMMLAHQLAPQVAEIAMNAAALLVRRRQYDEAAALLRPLAASPHSPELARAASRLLEQARPAPGPTAPPEPAQPQEE